MKKIFIKLLTIILICTVATKLKAQQPVSYNLYTLNPFLLNPAYTGSNGCLNAFVNSHNQWTNLNDAPAAQTLGLHGSLNNTSSIGGMVVSDNRTYVSYLSANLMYAHKIKISDNQSLSLGLSAGVANNKLNTAKLQMKDQNDALLQNFNTTRFDAGFGAMYAINSIKLGMSIPHFFDPNGKFSGQYNFQASYDRYTASKDWKLTPMLMARTYKEVGAIYDVNFLGTYKELVMGQLGYRTDKSIIAGIGVNWNNFTIAYAYQYHTGSTYNSFSSSGTQEIQLAFKLCKKAENPKAVDPLAEKVQVSVSMKDEKYQTPVPGNIIIRKGSVIRYSGNADASGTTIFYLEPDIYNVEISSKGYVPIQEDVNLSNNLKGSKFNYELKPTKIEKGLMFKLNTVTFETGSDKLKKSSFQVLDLMAKLFEENPMMVVEVAGYTDNTGDKVINQKLSENRANSVVDYLKTKGVKDSQMKSIGYGDANPIADNNTDEGRVQNRRVMFSVLEY